MIDSQNAPHGAPVLRVGLGVMFIAHALVLKFTTFGISEMFFTSLGLPAWTAYAAIAAEAIGGVLLVLGVWSRTVTVALIPVLIATLWVHSGFGWAPNATNVSWERLLF